MNRNISFADQIQRIQLVTGTRTQLELAACLGIRQSSVSAAKRRGAIPPGWLIRLMRVKNVNPEWVLTGRGTQLVEDIPPRGGKRVEPLARNAHEEALLMLRSLPSRLLADELVRRIAEQQSYDVHVGT